MTAYICPSDSNAVCYIKHKTEGDKTVSQLRKQAFNFTVDKKPPWQYVEPCLKFQHKMQNGLPKMFCKIYLNRDKVG